MRQRFQKGFQVALEFVVLSLTTSLALVVVLGVVFRKMGAALVWYDELASILLAWLTFYGAALAALHRAHIGFPKVVDGLEPSLRRALVVVGEVFVVGFFLVTAWAGWRVLAILGGETLVSLPWVPQRLAQSVVPIGAILFIVAELLTLPDVWAGPPSHEDSAAEGSDGAAEGSDSDESWEKDDGSGSRALGTEGPS
jgi:TRAP-type C4-dicarboxylate transport system permease small subunit